MKFFFVVLQLAVQTPQSVVQAPVTVNLEVGGSQEDIQMVEEPQEGLEVSSAAFDNEGLDTSKPPLLSGTGLRKTFKPHLQRNQHTQTKLIIITL